MKLSLNLIRFNFSPVAILDSRLSQVTHYELMMLEGTTEEFISA